MKASDKAKLIILIALCAMCKSCWNRTLIGRPIVVDKRMHASPEAAIYQTRKAYNIRCLTITDSTEYLYFMERCR